ncbi:MAG: AAA family ATPase [Oscillospiraceae bacterium]|nr:AAA family ATPase [Oscillospiraceae bacterium]
MEYGCIAQHLPHSFSKEIHEKIGSYNYILKELAPDELSSFMEARDFKAINVTIPYKQAVIPYLYKMDEFADKIGAVNTVVNCDGKLYGYNTDFYGLKALINRAGIDVKNKKTIILGSGGTSKTANAVLQELGAKEILTVSRKISETSVTYKIAATLHSDAQIIINTTPVGMFPNTDGCPIDIELFPKLEAVIDAVYNPLTTNIVSAAKNKGLKAENGLYMLVAQAVKAYEIFMDTAAAEGITEKIFNEIFSDKQNIVLIGMPGSGKTTIGKLLAKKLGREFIDTDDLIIKSAGKEIPDIFNEYGEEHFRKLEVEAVKEAAKNSNKVIATGGGAILRSENIKALKMNGKIYFLNRSPELLLPTDDRPLARDTEAIYKRYNERYDKYISAADETVPDNTDVFTVANDIERRHFS